MGSEIVVIIRDFVNALFNRPVFDDEMSGYLIFGAKILGAVLLVFIVVRLLTFIIQLRQRAINKSHFDSTKKLIEQINKSEYKDSPLIQMIYKCEEYAKKIDIHTLRKNNSKRIGALMLEFCHRFDWTLLTTIMYYCSCLIYDIGFLYVKEEYFHSELLTAKEVERLRKHVNHKSILQKFIPQEYIDPLNDAVMFHHKNVDGSGYPNNIKGKEIPINARIIHLVESYVALTSKRSYHKILSPKKALASLKKRSGSYDEILLEELEKIIENKE